MKRGLWIFLSVALLLGLAACASAPQAQTTQTTAPETSYDLVCDMQNFSFFSDIFEEKSPAEWQAMGRYTMLLQGLHTPVVVTMDGTDVVSVSAFGQTVELGQAGIANDYNDGYSPVYAIASTPEAVLIRLSGSENADDCILITPGQHFAVPQSPEYNTHIYIREDGILSFYRSWDTLDDFEQMGFQALETLTRRDAPLYQRGRVEIANNELVLTAEETATLSDEIDLDALFAEAKDAGWFSQYDTLDALLAANRAGGQ